MANRVVRSGLAERGRSARFDLNEVSSAPRVSPPRSEQAVPTALTGGTAPCLVADPLPSLLQSERRRSHRAFCVRSLLRFLHRLEAKQAAERQAERERQPGSFLSGDAAIQRALISVNRLDSGSFRPASPQHHQPALRMLLVNRVGSAKPWKNPRIREILGDAESIGARERPQAEFVPGSGDGGLKPRLATRRPVTPHTAWAGGTGEDSRRDGLKAHR